MNKYSPSNQIFQRLSHILLKVSKLNEIDEGPLKEALIKICMSACDGLNIDRASVWLLDPLKSYITCQTTCSSKAIISNDALVIKEETFPNYFSALLQERSIVANDALTHPHTKEFKNSYLIPLGITSMLDSPVRLRGNIAGILCCESKGPIKNWTQEEQSFAASLADIISRSLIANEKMISEEKLKKFK